MDNKELIQQFYTSFAKGDANGMVGCYADDVVFEDPAFGTLHSERAKKYVAYVGESKHYIDVQ